MPIDWNAVADDKKRREILHYLSRISDPRRRSALCKNKDMWTNWTDGSRVWHMQDAVRQI